MNYVVKSEELNDVTKKIENVVNLKMVPEITIMESLAKRPIWTGPARDAFVGKYDSVMQDISSMPKILELYIEFLVKSLNGYQDTFEEFKKKYKELEEELMMKGGKINELSNILRNRNNQSIKRKY